MYLAIVPHGRESLDARNCQTAKSTEYQQQLVVEMGTCGIYPGAHLSFMIGRSLALNLAACFGVAA
jgi:hypothetical protein